MAPTVLLPRIAVAVLACRPATKPLLPVCSHWHYIAQPGATLWFHNNRLQLMTTQFVLSDSRQQLLHLLETRWQQESETQDTTLRNVTQMEQALARRLWEMNQQGGQL